MKIYKVLPDLSRQRHMSIWHKALRSQWSAEDLDWGKPQRITKDVSKDQLAKVLTPIIMGEQSALYSVSGLIPKLGATCEVESQFYLTTWAVDEARHTELFARYYHRIGREPLPIRKFPSGYLFQSAIVSDDVGEWLSGVLISEVLAKLVMEDFRRLDLDPVLSEIADGILVDEARHLGFNHIYLEERFATLFRKAQEEGQTFGDHLRSRLHRVLQLILPIFEALGPDMRGVGLDPEALFGELEKDAMRRLEKSIEAGQKVAARESAASDPAEAARIGRE